MTPTNIKLLRDLEKTNPELIIVSELIDEIERLTPKPLLFASLREIGFRVIVRDDMPENEIWFATQSQIDKALDYSQAQIAKLIEKE